MDSKTSLERICRDQSLYSAEFVEKFGETSSFWESSNWFQREASLRHDMVCLLLSNTEYSQLQEREKIIESLEPPQKRQKLDDLPSCSSSTSHSSTNIGSDLKDEDFLDSADDSKYRYILLEGRSNIIMIQNQICKVHGIERISRQYDLFDTTEGKFIEVKVTKNFNKSLEEYLSYSEPPSTRCFVHVNPETFEITTRDKNDKMPGEGKVLQFLAKRKALMTLTLNVQETDMEYDEPLIPTIFPNQKFNSMVSEWVSSFWGFRELQLKEKDCNPQVDHPVKELIESKMKSLIEDTTKRDSKFMEFKAKLLPDPFTSCIVTEKDTDKDMISLLFEGLSFPFEGYMDWVINHWHEKMDNFNFINQADIKDAPEDLLNDLGIDQKGTIRNDHHPLLIQKEFKEAPRLRYSAWMSNLMKDMTELDSEGLIYFPNLMKEEFKSNHPIGIISQHAVNSVFQIFGETCLASYCSKVKNLYSRLGGAYLKRNHASSKRPSIVIFPLYASGHQGDNPKRKVTGFVIRGPQHAKKPTDRIPFISFEMLNDSQRGMLYSSFIKKAKIIEDNKGRKWCMRVNSIMKHDTSYLTFVIDSIYLTANMLGEMALQDIRNFEGLGIRANTDKLINNHRNWFLERMVESVFMAVMGNSQEEGTLAALRKMFMLKLNWIRGKTAWGADIEGFAESLNECLLDQPLALYFAKQFRDTLRD